MTPEQIANNLLFEYLNFENTGIWSDQYKYEDNIDNSSAALDIVTTNKYLEKSKVNDIFVLTEIGRKVIEKGGHFKYLKYIKDKSDQKDKSEKLDLNIKQWQVQTKYLPYIVSILALTFSIISYFKPEKKQQDLQLMQEKIKVLQDRVQLQDSLFLVDTLLKRGN